MLIVQRDSTFYSGKNFLQTQKEINNILRTTKNIIKKYIDNTNAPTLSEIRLLIASLNEIDIDYKKICEIDNINLNEYKNNLIKIIEQNKMVSNILIKRANEYAE